MKIASEELALVPVSVSYLKEKALEVAQMSLESRANYRAICC